MLGRGGAAAGAHGAHLGDHLGRAPGTASGYIASPTRISATSRGASPSPALEQRRLGQQDRADHEDGGLDDAEEAADEPPSELPIERAVSQV